MVSIGRDYYGSEFNRLCAGETELASDKTELTSSVTFYRILNGDLKHHGYQFQLGLNVDIVSDSYGEHSSGALYFYDKSKCHIFSKYYDNNCKLAIIRIPDNARVHVEKNRFMADSFIIETLIDYADIDIPNGLCHVHDNDQ